MHRIERFKNIDKINQLKIELANDLLRFQQKLEISINRTLNAYEAALNIIHRNNLNRLRMNQDGNQTNEFLELDLHKIQLNRKMIKFCYGDLDELSDEVIVEFIKYFTLVHFEESHLNIDLGRINYHYRNRYNEIMEMKDKIQDSILIQLQKLNA